MYIFIRLCHVDTWLSNSAPTLVQREKYNLNDSSSRVCILTLIVARSVLVRRKQNIDKPPTPRSKNKVSSLSGNDEAILRHLFTAMQW